MNKQIETSPFKTSRPSAWRRYVYGLVAAELSTVTRWADRLIEVISPLGDDPLLRTLTECPQREVVENASQVQPYADADSDETSSVILLNGNLNHVQDIQTELETLLQTMGRSDRILAVLFNPYLFWLYRLAGMLGVRRRPLPSTFLTRADLNNLARLSGFEVVRLRQAVYFPIWIPVLSNLINQIMPTIPLLKWLSLVSVAVLRPLKTTREPQLSLSIVIPARNERGNIGEAIRRLPDFGGVQIEVVFVEGHSNDGTWEEIQQQISTYTGPFTFKAAQQPGKGKCDAVRLGISMCSGNLVTILDADLTMPPELLPRFYQAYTTRQGDFINGSRLLYPMEGQAMRFLNRLGNVFFAKALSSVLQARITDSLCGTKLLSRRDYHRIVKWRERFGDFDPFGDFELLFGASELSLGMIDIPIPYRARQYGQTNIRRFRDGLILLRMTALGFFRLRLGKCSR